MTDGIDATNVTNSIFIHGIIVNVLFISVAKLTPGWARWLSRTGEGVSCPRPPTYPTVYTPNMMMMREMTMPSAQFVNSVTKPYAMNVTMVWLGRTGNGVSCLSPSTLSVVCMLEMTKPSAMYANSVTKPSTMHVLMMSEMNFMMTNEMTESVRIEPMSAPHPRLYEMNLMVMVT